MDNMFFYNQSRAVPEEAQKQFSNGSFSGTDINPMWRIKKMTEMFGPCGIGWYYEIVSERAEEHHDMTMAIVDINLYIKVDGEWSKPIFGTGGNTLVKPTSKGQKASDEGYKMALTDALSVACKALGVGADIYFGKDKTKYTQYHTDELPQMKTPEEVGQERLKEYEDKINAIRARREEQPEQPAKGKATPEQIEYIKANADDETYVKAMTAFGTELEKMTAAQAAKLIGRISKAG